MFVVAKRSTNSGTVDDSAQVGQRLRSAREELGLSLREVARRLDISASALSQIETGKSRPSVKTLYAIVSELGLSMDELFAEGGEDAQPAASVPTSPEEAAARARAVFAELLPADLDTPGTWLLRILDDHEGSIEIGNRTEGGAWVRVRLRTMPDHRDTA